MTSRVCALLHPQLGADSGFSVADDLAGLEEDQVLGDVGQQVADAFEFSCEPVQVEAEFFFAWVGSDDDDRVPEELLAECVDSSIAGDHVFGGVFVLVDDGTKQAVALDRHALGEFDQRGRPWKFVTVADFAEDLGDRAGVVAHALEMDIDLQGEDKPAEVAGHGLLQGEHSEAGLLDADLFGVDLFISEQNLFDGGRVDRPGGRGERGLDHGDSGAAFGDQPLAYRIEQPIHAGCRVLGCAGWTRALSGLTGLQCCCGRFLTGLAFGLFARLCLIRVARFVVQCLRAFCLLLRRRVIALPMCPVRQLFVRLIACEKSRSDVRSRPEKASSSLAAEGCGWVERAWLLGL